MKFIKNAAIHVTYGRADVDSCPVLHLHVACRCMWFILVSSVQLQDLNQSVHIYETAVDIIIGYLYRLLLVWLCNIYYFSQIMQYQEHSLCTMAADQFWAIPPDLIRIATDNPSKCSSSTIHTTHHFTHNKRYFAIFSSLLLLVLI